MSMDRTTKSGSPIVHAPNSPYSIGSGRSAGLPSGASLSTQAWDQGQLFVAEGLVVLELVDPYVLFDKERRHGAHPVPGWPCGA